MQCSANLKNICQLDPIQCVHCFIHELVWIFLQEMLPKTNLELYFHPLLFAMDLLLRLLYTVSPPTQQVLSLPSASWVGKNKTSWSAKLDTFISFAHTDHLFSFSKGSWRGHRPSSRWPKRWEQPQTGLPSQRLWFAPVCLSRWNQCTRSRKSSQPRVWLLLRIVMKFDWETILRLSSDKSCCQTIKNDSLHKSDSPGSQLGVHHNRPVGKSSQFCLKDLLLNCYFE